MTVTIIELRKSSNEGRLYYKPDPETRPHLLLMESSPWRPMAYCVNVSGGWLLLYFDAQRKLRDIEVGIPRKRWQKLSNLPEPKAIESADIFLRGVASFHGKWKHPHVRRRSSDNSTIRSYEYDHPVIVVTNPDLSSVQIMLGSTDKLSRWIALSEHCWAQIAENRLKGFFVKISD